MYTLIPTYHIKPLNSVYYIQKWTSVIATKTYKFLRYCLIYLISYSEKDKSQLICLNIRHIASLMNLINKLHTGIYLSIR